MALCRLCAEQVLWERKSLTTESRPYSRSNAQSRLLHQTTQGGSQWLEIIFGISPKDKYLRNFGSARSNTHRIEFTEFVNVDVRFDNISAPTEILESFLSDHHNTVQGPMPPRIKLRHVHRTTLKTTEISATDQNRGFYVCEGDEVSLSAILSSPELFSLYWIDSRFKSLILISPYTSQMDQFTVCHERHGDNSEIVVVPAIGFDSEVGMETTIGIVHKSKPSIDSIRDLERSITDFAKTIPAQPLTEWHSFNYETSWQQRKKLGAFPISPRSDYLNRLIDILHPWAASFQVALVPHKSP